MGKITEMFPGIYKMGEEILTKSVAPGTNVYGERIIRLGKEEIETGLSLGLSSETAMEEHGKQAVKAAIMPTVDRLKTLGIIFIPGAVTGLIMAGTDPIVAAEYQMIIYFMITGGGIITSLATIHLMKKRIFTDAEQLAEWV